MLRYTHFIVSLLHNINIFFSLHARLSEKYLDLYGAICSLQPVLQYSSAFDDEVEELTEELPNCPEPNLENELENPPESGLGAACEPQLDVVIPANQGESVHPSTGVVHGPYYYFYQGNFFLAPFFLF